MIDYCNKVALAPMVRFGELPSRLLALHLGADLVWGPEIIDRKLVDCVRTKNDSLGTTDFVHPKAGVVFRTCPFEKKRLIFQIGTASPDIAVQAAKIVASDVAQIDVNAGCPKHFSYHGGMGAALLKTPDLLEEILRSLVTDVGRPFQLPISVKIRVLSSVEETVDLVERLCKTGISCLTLHSRFVQQNPTSSAIPNREVYLEAVAKACAAHGVACYANGSIQDKAEGLSVISQYGTTGAMIGHSASHDLSVFDSSTVPWMTQVRSFLELARAYENSPPNTKYCVLRLIPGKDPLRQIMTRMKSHDEMLSLVESA
ncbi:hypothetical protein CANCADRAFT_19618, partial [Tortispora caseinolytica NRRL Y-17796]